MLALKAIYNYYKYFRHEITKDFIRQQNLITETLFSIN